MKESLRLFNQRKGEIETYFSFLATITQRGAKIQLNENHHEDIDIDTLHILKANGFILLYNLVESCISQAIEDIYQDAIENEHSYDELKEEIQTELLKYIKKKDVAELAKAMNSISVDIIKHYPARNDIFSGNLAAKEVKEIGKKYGFSVQTNARQTNNGANLVTIKAKRNDLAHGYISFKDCGKDFPITQVIEIKQESLLYIEQILINVATFIDDKKYLKRDS